MKCHSPPFAYLKIVFRLINAARCDKAFCENTKYTLLRRQKVKTQNKKRLLFFFPFFFFPSSYLAGPVLVIYYLLWVFLLFATLKDTFCHFVANNRKRAPEHVHYVHVAAFILRWLTERKKGAINSGVTPVQWTSPSDWRRGLMHRPCHISVGCYDHAARAQHSQTLLLLRHIHHITICSGGLGCPSNRWCHNIPALSIISLRVVKQCTPVCVGVRWPVRSCLNFSLSLRWKIIPGHVSRLQSDTFWLLEAVHKSVCKHRAGFFGFFFCHFIESFDTTGVTCTAILDCK